MSLKDKLNLYKHHLTHKTAASDSRVDSTSWTAIPFPEKWDQLQSHPFAQDDEYIMIREVRYPVTTRHGQHTFAELYDTLAKCEQRGLVHPLFETRLAPENLLFFDTETTGLSGGAGNAIFLLGHTRFEEDEVVVRQHFLTALQNEITLYESFLHHIEGRTHLITFNGKSFDWPQVKTRHTLLRGAVSELPTFEHYDLLHAARRLWKHDLESCRLSLIEQSKLGVTRVDDIPGYIAPVLYFEYLRHQDPDTIKGVLYHNEVDVLSLVTLYIHILNILIDSDDKDATTWEEQFEVARWYEALGQFAEAESRYLSVAHSDHALHTRAKLALAVYYKRQKDWRQALYILEECATSLDRPNIDVYLELAKLYEHQVRDYEKALDCTVQAFEMWRETSRLLRRQNRVEAAAYDKRIQRLKHKLMRG